MKIRGQVRVPGDKSLTHRVLLLGGLCRGRSRVRGALTSLDARSTARVLRQLGVGVSPLRAGQDVDISGRSRFSRPADTLHCGNSGTSARLLLGLLAAHRFAATITGDRSLRRRPMRRVTDPLSLMGAGFASGSKGRDGLPVTVRGSRLSPLSWELPVSSAQIKSAVLLAGLAGGVPVSVREPAGRSRDHTERLLAGMGYGIVDDPESGWIHFTPEGGQLEPFDVTVPGDPSSAAYLVGAALLAESGELAIQGVGLNPTRTGFLSVVGRMGGVVHAEERGRELGEPVGDLVVRPSELRGTVVAPDEIPGLIDEIPLLAILAARARGTTVFREVGELRVKESDRLRLLADNLTRLGVEAAAEDNVLTVQGTDRPPVGRVVTEGDHRIAMAFAVLATVRGAKVRVDDPGCADVSFPGFAETLRGVVTR